MNEIAKRANTQQLNADHWLGAIEGSMFHEKASEAYIALALYRIKEDRLFAPEFTSFERFVEAKLPAICKRTVWNWVSSVGKLTPETFIELAAKTGMNQTLFNKFALLPADVQNVLINEDSLEVDGETYDFKGKTAKEYKALIFRLAAKVNEQKERYNSLDKTKKHNKESHKTK